MNYLDKIRILLLKIKNAFNQFMLHVYNNCFPKLSNELFGNNC